MQHRSKKLNSLILSAIVAVGATLAPTQAFGANNGAGYGGPTLKPEVVPSAAEQGYTLVNPLDAYDKCLFAGTAESPSMIAQYLTQLYGQQIDVDLRSMNREAAKVDTKARTQLKVGYSCEVRRNLNEPSYYVPHPRPYAICTMTNENNQLIFDLTSIGDVPDVKLAVYLPTIQIERTAGERLVNSWGKVVSDTYRYFGVKVKNADKAPGAVWNFDRSPDYVFKTSFAFPYQALKSCLKTELQKAAQ